MMSIQTLYLVTSLVLIVIGLGGAMLRNNLIKMVLGFSIADAGVNILMITMGYVDGGTAPIIDNPAMFSNQATQTVRVEGLMDPIPQALVLTAIVIGVGVTALMLAYVVRIYAHSKTLSVSALRSLKW